MGADLAGAVRADEYHAFVDEVAGQELEQVPGHGVGPVQVLEPHEHRVINREMGDQFEYGDEQPSVRRVGLVGDNRAGCEPVAERRQIRRVGQQIRSRPADLAEEIGERDQGNGVAADVGGPPQVEGDIGSQRALAHDRRLADARVTAHQHDGRQPFACVDDHLLEDRQLRVSSNESLFWQAVTHDAVQYRVPSTGRHPAHYA